jgi:hypothetical protein
MKDFAKLFVRENIGQVLVTREENPETDLPGVVVRIPDYKDLEVRVTLGMNTPDYDRAEKFADDLFASVTEANIDTVLADIIAMRNQMDDQMDAGDTNDGD